MEGEIRTLGTGFFFKPNRTGVSAIVLSAMAWPARLKSADSSVWFHTGPARRRLKRRKPVPRVRISPSPPWSRVEQTGKGSKRRWNVWKYLVIEKGLEERFGMHPQNPDPFQSSEEAIAFRNRIAPNRPR